MLRFSFVLAACALLATAAAADPLVMPAADQVGADPIARLMDVNHDGVITHAEFRRHNANQARWRALDRNNDGVLDATEQAAGLTPGPRVMR